MIFDGEKKAYILSEQEYDEMFDGEARANLELIKVINQLENKLEIATRALEYYTLEDAYVSCYGNPVNPNPMVARKALKEMEGVK